MRRPTRFTFPSLDGDYKGRPRTFPGTKRAKLITGTIVEWESSHHGLLERADPSWPRPAAAREVTYGFTMTETGDVVRIAFRIGDLAIDSESEGWRDSYATSRVRRQYKLTL